MGEQIHPEGEWIMPQSGQRRDAKERRRELRRNATDAETVLWRRLCDGQVGGVSFRRQYSIGPFIVDFCCVPRKLALEIDGGQHALPENAEAVARRTRYIEAAGFTVLRFWNNDVLARTGAVVELIARTVTAIPADGGRAEEH